MLKKTKQVTFLILIVVLLLLKFSPATDYVRAQSNRLNIYFFWGIGCPHCEQAKPVLEALAAGEDNITLFEFEVYDNEENLNLFYQFAEAYDTTPQGVPTIFIGDRYWIGYTDNIKLEIERYIQQCLANGCQNLGAGIVENDESEPVTTPPEEEVTEDGNIITLPLIGTINLSHQSLLFSTLLISLVDGFNPCSIWVLSMLLAVTLNTRSRKKVLIIGFVFILVTGLIYAAFIAGLFSVLRVVRFVGWIQVVVALIALAFGLINIKDYFWYKEGVSLTISDEKKPGIYKGMRRIMKAEGSLWAMIVATIILAAGVSLVEFSCTAGFPVLWTNLLNSQNVSDMTFWGLLLVYMIIYQIDELGIFLVSVFTLRKTRFEEKHGRALKLVGGMLMLTLAVVMLVDPTIMNHVGSSLLVFGVAFGLACLVLLVHRVILPKLNLNIDSKR